MIFWRVFEFMNSRVSELEMAIASYEFAEMLTETQKAELNEMKAELETLRKKSGIAVKIDGKWYLTDTPTLPLCETPTLFDSVEEANEYLKKADLGNRRNIEYERY